MNVTGRRSAKRRASFLRQKHCLIGLAIFILLATVLLIHLFSDTLFAQLPLSYTQQASISDAAFIGTNVSLFTTWNLDQLLCDNTTDHACERIRCAVILRAKNGRLGNRMFMFASAYGLARTHQCRLHVSDAIREELSNHFSMKSIDARIWLSNEHVARIKGIAVIHTICSFFPDLMQPYAFRNLEITGFWQSYLYFDAYRNDVQRVFSSRHETLIRLASHLSQLITLDCPSCPALPMSSHDELRDAFRTRGNITWIGVHIRRTDFRDVGFSSDDNYIRRAMAFYRRRYSTDRVRFLVASDDKSYCHRLLAAEKASEEAFVLPDLFSTSDDLTALSLCHHSIVTGGTYGFWVAYLAGGDVVHDVKYEAACLRADYYPPWFLLPGKVLERKE